MAKGNFLIKLPNSLDSGEVKKSLLNSSGRFLGDVQQSEQRPSIYGFTPTQNASPNSASIDVVYEAFQNGTVINILDFLAKTVAQLPWRVMQVGKDGMINPTGKQKGLSAEINRRLAYPNYEQTAYQFKYQMIFSLKAWGNAFIQLSRERPDDIPRSMIVKNPYKMRPIVEGQGDFVKITRFEFIGDAAWADYKPWQIMQIQDVVADGVTAESILLRNVDKVRELIQIDNYIIKTFANGARFSGILSLPSLLQEEDEKNVDQILALIQNQFSLKSYPNRAGGVFVTGDADVKFIETNMMAAPITGDLLELRKQIIGELGAAFGLTPSMTAADLSTTFNNANSYQQSFFRDTIYPIIMNLEESLTRSFLGNEHDGGEGTLRICFDTSSLVKGSLKEMVQQAQVMASMGAFTVNEIREFMGYKPRDDGDELLSTKKPEVGHDDEPVEPDQGTGEQANPAIRLVGKK